MSPRPVLLLVSVGLVGLSALGALGPLGCLGRPSSQASAADTLAAGRPDSARHRGPTAAPDLLSVGAFREGPSTDEGGPTTLVDFRFDGAVYLVNGNASAFALVPVDGRDAVRGTTNVPLGDVDAAGDSVVTVPFEGALEADAYARAFVDTGVAVGRDAAASPENPANINLAAPVGAADTTANPDLVRAVRDGDTVLFEFDEALTDDDLVQNSSGLRLFFPAAREGSTIPFAGALAVKEEGPATLRAYFGRDLPGGFGLADAAGAFVVQGAVQAAPDARGGNDGTNGFASAHPLGDTGATVCAPAGAPPGGAGDSLGGPTAAPDLVAAGNLRRGPYTAQFVPTTCVDFWFDQAAYLRGGDRSNFHLVPVDGGDALSGTTNVRTPHDREGDRVVTVVFPGALEADAFARAYVDAGVVGSDSAAVTSADPANAAQARPLAPRARTDNPDLTEVRLEGDSAYVFVFDEALTRDDLVQNNSGLQLYFPDTRQSSTVPTAGAFRVEVVGPAALRAFYTDLPEGFALADAVGASVAQGSVQAARGARGGNDGKNGFDALVLSGAGNPASADGAAADRNRSDARE